MIFDIFKKRKNEIIDPFIKFEQAIVLLPEFYRTGPTYLNCIKQSSNRNPEAVNSLILLTKVDGHYFSNYFWRELSECAKLLSLSEQVAYCERQMDKNSQELDENIPKGWTTIKISETSYQHHIAHSIRDEWAETQSIKTNEKRRIPLCAGW